MPAGRQRYQPGKSNRLDVYFKAMPNAAHRQEIEIKLRVADVAGLRILLKRLRAREIVPRTHEYNTLYDTPQQNLRRRGRLIRIRIEQPAANFARSRSKQGSSAVVTYKAPISSPKKAAKVSRKFKLRTRFKIKGEAEVSFSSAQGSGAEEMAGILRALGLRSMFHYEKFRTTYVLPNLPGLKIELDETPVGIYLELEGHPATIDRCARLLEYQSKDYVKSTYGALYLADCRRRGQKPGHMLFPPTKKLR